MVLPYARNTMARGILHTRHAACATHPWRLWVCRPIVYRLEENMRHIGRLLVVALFAVILADVTYPGPKPAVCS